MDEVIAGLPTEFGGGSVELVTFRSEGDYIGNNWTESPNGEGYLSRIEAGRPDLPQRARDLRARVEAVNREFDAKYGWGPTAVLAARRRATVDASVIRAGSLGVAREYGTGVAGASRFTGVHFSGQPRPRVLRGAAAGRVASRGARPGDSPDFERFQWALCCRRGDFAVLRSGERHAGREVLREVSNHRSHRFLCRLCLVDEHTALAVLRTR